ncbi:MAG: hypothetical protein EOR34_10775 [Mesorhizobium sp.]|uniref:hypothetical protein n=1 Tax=Mesorhizobium sp. TaxID=1871066 RepID=UPI000FE76AD1|nr:hypothetical protein [Mesorhizobium sp.]RWI48375.1 MAG: hypothetical protein EOR15_13515 [Mesorhizobium sp.]RWI88126.1 MAG: hypothetical protein EOR20_03570 [Mesorhizobium sp.]RWJ60116.1 MAG: hypothetical protein EOR32_19695 [Mesorhizobium sp.]RWJ74366.1 MAG: hypothetical protein EOR34_10775 [Mesorhizobium sp.]
MADFLLPFEQAVAKADQVELYESPGLVEDGWYRYEDSSSSTPSIHLRRLRVLRETPKGVWLDDYVQERFVLKDANKRWAYPTIELARASFLIRKRRQVQHLKIYLEHAEAVLAAAEKFFNG